MLNCWVGRKQQTNIFNLCLRLLFLWVTNMCKLPPTIYIICDIMSNRVGDGMVLIHLDDLHEN